MKKIKFEIINGCTQDMYNKTYRSFAHAAIQTLDSIVISINQQIRNIVASALSEISPQEYYEKINNLRYG